MDKEEILEKISDSADFFSPGECASIYVRVGVQEVGAREFTRGGSSRLLTQNGPNVNSRAGIRSAGEAQSDNASSS